MGIFGSKKQDNQLAQDDPMNIAAPQAVVNQGSIDGVVSTYQDPSTLAPDPTNIGAPPLDEQASTDDYIMTDPPVQSSDAWSEPAHQHDIETEPEKIDVSVQPQTPVSTGPDSAVDPYEAARSVPSTHPLPDATTPATTTTDDLATIKEQAIRELSPLVSKLDQSPEERFHTAMMMLQATDDHSIVKTAYEAAQEITDEKTRAQALLDIVNEINYFTQNKN